MTEYLIYFNQQWVGDHTEEWFRGRGPLAMAVVDEIKAAGVYVFAGGLEEEDGPVFSADATSGTLMFTDGPYVESKEFLGGLDRGGRGRRGGRQDVGRQDRGSVRLAPGGSTIQAAAHNPVMRSRLVNREPTRATPRSRPRR